MERKLPFIVRGDVYVTSVDYETTKQITNTPAARTRSRFQPRRTLIWFTRPNGVKPGSLSEQPGAQGRQILPYAQELEGRAVGGNFSDLFPADVFSDGKEVAFLENRTTLRVINLKANRYVLSWIANTTIRMPMVTNITNGHPTANGFLAKYIAVGGWNNTDIVLVKADGSEMTNLTESGYSDNNAKWVLDGKAMIWSSDRAGYRSHGSWGAQRRRLHHVLRR